ncbi:hypothetical protein P2318_20435 [Myxococcaceae bacterium GXIMD 01537]
MAISKAFSLSLALFLGAGVMCVAGVTYIGGTKVGRTFNGTPDELAGEVPGVAKPMGRVPDAGVPPDPAARPHAEGQPR